MWINVPTLIHKCSYISCSTNHICSFTFLPSKSIVLILKSIPEQVKHSYKNTEAYPEQFEPKWLLILKTKLPDIFQIHQSHQCVTVKYGLVS